MATFIKCPECGNEVRIRNAEMYDVLQIECHECHETVELDVSEELAKFNRVGGSE